MYRHIRQNCKIAHDAKNTEIVPASPEKGTEDTQRQIAEQLAELTALLKEKMVPSTQLSVGSIRSAVQTIGTAVHVDKVEVNLRPWSGDRIYIPVSLVKAAFEENPRLIEYCRLSDSDKVDAEKAAPYIVEAIVDIIRRAHIADPSSRNIYLNPKRADQVVVFDETSWNAITLIDSIRILAETVVDRLRKITTSNEERRELAMDVQGTVCYVPMMYDEAPEKYVEQAKAALAAHLANLRPPGMRRF